MRQLKIRYARANEAGQIIEWLHANKQADFDPAILKYPSLQLLCAYEDEGPIAYLPIQRVLVLESFAVKPGTSTLVAAQAGRDLTKAAELIASAHEIRELMFLGGQGGMGKMATRHGYEELACKVFRMKLQ